MGDQGQIMNEAVSTTGLEPNNQIDASLKEDEEMPSEADLTSTQMTTTTENGDGEQPQVDESTIVHADDDNSDDSEEEGIKSLHPSRDSSICSDCDACKRPIDEVSTDCEGDNPTKVEYTEARKLAFPPLRIRAEKGGIYGPVHSVSETSMLETEGSQKRLSGAQQLAHTLRHAINDGVYGRMRLARGVIVRVNKRMRAECRLCRFRRDYECYLGSVDSKEKDETLAAIEILPQHIKKLIEHLVNDEECLYCDLRLVIGELACVDSVSNEGFISILDDIMDMKRFLCENHGYDPIIRD